MSDFDTILSGVTRAQADRFSVTLSVLEYSDLGDWDQTFIESLIDKVDKTSAMKVLANLSDRQHEQLQRIKDEQHAY